MLDTPEQTAQPTQVTGVRAGMARLLLTVARRLAPDAASRAQPLTDIVAQYDARQHLAASKRPAVGQQTTPQTDPLQEQMYTNQAPQGTPAAVFAPGAPLQPYPGISPEEGPRQFQFQPGYNILLNNRAGEATSFAQLRNLAFNYDGIQLAEHVWFDVINRLHPHVTFEANVIPDGESDQDPKWRDIAQPAEDWLMYPDGQMELSEWLTASVRDVLELGYSPIYIRRNLLGEIMGLDLVDPPLMKPLITDRGRQPDPPWPAWRQIVYGAPGAEYTREEVLCVRETVRTDSTFSFSRVERIVLTVNEALRKKSLDLTRYTDGSIPEGIIFPDSDLQWSVEQTQEFERLFNDLLGGNQKRLVRMKVGPPGGTFVASRPQDPQIEFDRFMLNLTAAMFGTTLDELGFTETSNRSTGKTQEAVIYRRVVKPVALRYAKLLTRILKVKFDSRLKLEWAGIEEPDDLLAKARTLNIGVQNGALSPSRMAHMMGWPVDARTGPFVKLGKDLVFLDDANDLREAQMDAKVAALEFAAKNPGATDNGDVTAESGAGLNEPPAPPSQGPGRARQKKPASTTRPAAEAKQDTAAEGEPRAAQSAQSASEEYAQWYRACRKALKYGRPLPLAIRVQHIDLESQQMLAHDLAGAATPEGVKAAFSAAREREALVALP